MQEISGEKLLAILLALANPHRLRVIAALTRGRQHVSGLAREIGISRPLLHMHLQRLLSAGLVSSRMELSDDGKAKNYFELVPFKLELTPDLISRLAPTLET